MKPLSGSMLFERKFNVHSAFEGGCLLKCEIEMIVFSEEYNVDYFQQFTLVLGALDNRGQCAIFF